MGHLYDNNQVLAYLKPLVVGFMTAKAVSQLPDLVPYFTHKGCERK